MPKAWGTVREAAAILSENAGRNIHPAYVRELAKLQHVRARVRDGRTNEYHLGDCRKYTVRQKKGKEQKR